MRKLLTILILGLLLSGNAYANENSEIILGKLSKSGEQQCQDMGFGKHVLEDNVVTFIDISNDGIEDMILNTSKQQCEKSGTFFSGTAGSNYIFFINPKKTNLKAWDDLKETDKKNKIYSKLLQDFEITEFNNKNVIKVFSHGSLCNVAGYIGCYTIFEISEDGFKKLEGPNPNPS